MGGEGDESLGGSLAVPHLSARHPQQQIKSTTTIAALLFTPHTPQR